MRRADAGAVEALPLLLLTFVVGTLVLTQSWAVIAAREQAAAAAGAGLRALVEADEPAPHRVATDAARAAIEPAQRSRPWEIESTGSAGRCRPVTVRVATRVPLLHLPWIGPAASVPVTVSRSGVIDPYRRGVGGVAVCRD